MELTDSDFTRLRDYMYATFGIDLSKKKGLIERRLSEMVKSKGFSDFSSYIDNLLRDQSGVEVSLLVTKLTTNFTYFMREKEHFEFMKNTALPQIVPTIKDKSLAVWSAACSSGEEPYTISMVIDEYFGYSKKGFDTRILATDISPKVLAMADKGIYSLDRVTNLSGDKLARYFDKTGGNNLKVKPELRKQLILKEFNLMEPSYKFKKKFHIIFCRNVMIYFDNKVRESIANKMYDALAPGGYLFIGLSETLTNVKSNLTYVQPSVYKRNF